MIEILSLKERAFGMEITDEAIRIMQLAFRRGVVVLAAASSVAIDSGVVRHGEVKDIDKLAKAIKAALAAAGKNLDGRRVVISLPENKAFLQVIPMPKLKEEELRAAVIFEAENYIPLPLEKVYLDFEEIPSPPEAKRGEVLAVAMPREIIDSRIQAVKLAGLTPMALELESQATVRALTQDCSPSAVQVIIHIGDAKANLIICARGSIRFTFSIPISNRYFLETIAANAKTGMNEARVLKSAYGIEEFVRPGETLEEERNSSGVNAEKRKIFEALIPGLVDFVQQLKKCFQYFQTHDKQGTGAEKTNIEEIFICGSGADLKGLDTFIALKLNVRTLRLSPPFCSYESIAECIKNFPGKNTSSFVVAAGLALRALGSKAPVVSDSAATKSNTSDTESKINVKVRKPSGKHR